MFFSVPRPHHFAVRRDLFDELCLTQHFLQSLPRDECEYRAWLRVAGATEIQFPEASLRADLYQPGRRFVLRRVALPRDAFAQNLVQLESGWVTATQRAGLPNFVFARAIEYAVIRGVSRDFACDQFSAPLEPDIEARRPAPWAIGIERETGLATIIDARVRGALRRYLNGRRDYGTPFR